MKKSTNQLDTNGKQSKPESDSKSSRSLAQSQNTIDESVPEKSQNTAKDTMKNNEEDENNRHPCHDCILVNINPNLTMHVCSVINQYMYFCGHCGESVNVKLKSFKTLSQESAQHSSHKSTKKSAQKSTHKSPQNTPASTSKSRSRSKSSDMDTSSDQKEEETEQAQDNSGKKCPKCNESWENPSESTSNNSNNQADKRARSDHDTTEDSTEDPSLSIRRLRNSKTTVNARKIAEFYGKPFSDKPFFDEPFLTNHFLNLIMEIFMTVDLYRQKMKSNKINRHKIAPKLTINQRIQRRR